MALAEIRDSCRIAIALPYKKRKEMLNNVAVLVASSSITRQLTVANCSGA